VSSDILWYSEALKLQVLLTNVSLTVR